MSNIALFIEGGGQFERERRILRAGFDSFFQPLKKIATERSKSFRIVVCGSRDETFRSFQNERRFDPLTHSLLLVDSEEILTVGIKEHLALREAHWELAAVPETDLHVMTAVMETWIVADLAALRNFYGQRFAANKLPSHTDLEKVQKPDVCRSLDAATMDTQAGSYHKMKHAPKLLSRMDAQAVRHKCPHCNRLFESIDGALRE